MTTNQSLKREAQYGKLPFDQFVLDQWNYSRPYWQDRPQWNQLVQQYLSLDMADRAIYHKAAWFVGHLGTKSEHLLPTPDQIDRVLMPHQTPFERNLSFRSNGPIWLRTCYAPELADSYEKMTRRQLEGVVQSDAILDDEELYSFESSWHLILNRLPSLCDVDNGITPDDTAYWDPPVEPLKQPLFEAGLMATSMIYLLDRQALEEELVTVLWLDCHGECVWWCRIHAMDLRGFTSFMLSTAAPLVQLSRRYVDEADETQMSIFEKGALVEWDF